MKTLRAGVAQVSTATSSAAAPGSAAKSATASGPQMQRGNPGAAEKSSVDPGAAAFVRMLAYSLYGPQIEAEQRAAFAAKESKLSAAPPIDIAAAANLERPVNAAHQAIIAALPKVAYYALATSDGSPSREGLLQVASLHHPWFWVDCTTGRAYQLRQDGQAGERQNIKYFSADQRAKFEIHDDGRVSFDNVTYRRGLTLQKTSPEAANATTFVTVPSSDAVHTIPKNGTPWWAHPLSRWDS